MEVSSHALDQRRVDGTWFDVACFTNLSHDHLDYHATVDEYFEAKARLFTPAFTSRAAIGVDGPRGTTLADRARADGLEVLTFGSTGEVRARNVELTPDHSTFVIEHGRDSRPVRTSLVGAFNVANVLAAFATARLAGFTMPETIDVRVPGRMERVDAGQPFTVIVDYAHTPDALRAVLDVVRPLGERVLLVFGCGGDRDRAKRPVMGALAATRADVAYLTNDNPRSEDPHAIADDVLAGVPSDCEPPIVELDRRLAIRAALRAARTGDVVVIAGKGHESGQTTDGMTVAFDDRVVAREELEARA
jgi:UDP-N-acetylmuramoyl-L-alanyl-D-glutamate--2,6-diaminopimelate ligase